MTSTKDTVSIVSTIKTAAREAIETAESYRDQAHLALNGFRASLLRQARELYDACGGCEHCGGRGWTVAWDTMDSLSGCYAEYAPCACGGRDRERFGFVRPSDHGSFSKYDRNHDGITEDTWIEGLFNTMPEGAQYRKIYEMIQNDAAKAQTALDEAREFYSIRKGVEVVVVRDRGNVTAPIGLVGRVFAVKATSFGRYGYRPTTIRLGVKDDSGNVFWTTEKNCELTDPNVAAEEIVTVRVAAIVRNSEKARLVRFFTNEPGKTVETWIPKSVILDSNEHENNTLGKQVPVRFQVAKWWADENRSVATR